MLNRSSTRVSSGSGFLSKAKANLAHTSTIPLLGNQDLRLLQNLIIEEKTVIGDFDRLSASNTKDAAALAAWGEAEGDDLSDVLSQTRSMLDCLSEAYGCYAGRCTGIRQRLKTIRSQEEELDDLKKRRRNVGGKAESAEKKLVKMSSENKYLQQQTDLLQTLRNEMRSLDTLIMNEEAKLSDAKRLVTKESLAIKFSALSELAEKMTIVGELGMLMIQEIPLDTTPPGYGRSPYSSQGRTAQLAEEARKCIGGVRYDAPSFELGPKTEPENAGPTPSIGGGTYANYERYASETPTSPNEYDDGNPQFPSRLQPIRQDTTTSSFTSPASTLPSVHPPFVLSAEGQEVPTSAQPLSPAMSYRNSFTAGLGSPVTREVPAFAQRVPSASTVRDDGYGNEIPLGERPGEGQDVEYEAQQQTAPSSRTETTMGSTGRPRIAGPRLSSLGLGSPITNLNATQNSLTPPPPSPPYDANPSSQVPQASRESTYLPYVDSSSHADSPSAHTFGHDSSELSEPTSTSRSLPPPPASLTHSTAAYSPPYSNQPLPSPAATQHFQSSSDSTAEHDFYPQPPRAPYTQPQLDGGGSPITENERESYVDAPDAPAVPAPPISPPPPPPPPVAEASPSTPNEPYPEYAYAYEERPASPLQPVIQLPRPPQIIEPPRSASPAYFPEQPTPTANSYSNPRDQTQTQHDHQSASAAAQREVEREMDNLAFTSASPSSRPEVYSPTSETMSPSGSAASGGKVKAGAFFKRRQQGALGRTASPFQPPDRSDDDGVSEEDGRRSLERNTEPLNIRRSLESSKGPAPPYE